jgi:RNA polymerase sigma-70 factor (ECF subfamily)
LVRRLIEGDEAAFEEFAGRQIPALYRFAARRLHGDRELTRDVVQSTLCKAISSLASFRGEAALTTWLCACCRNEIAAHFRRRQRAGIELDYQAVEQAGGAPGRDQSVESPEGSLLRQEAADLVHEALDALPAHYGRALEWKYMESASVHEIAGRLSLGPKAAESLLTRARQAFREEYDRLAAALRPTAGSYAAPTARMEAK